MRNASLLRPQASKQLDRVVPVNRFHGIFRQSGMHQVARGFPRGDKWKIASKKNLGTWNDAHESGKRCRIAGAGGIVILALQFVEYAVGYLSLQVFGKGSGHSICKHRHRSPAVRKNKPDVGKPGERPIREETLDRPGRVEQKLHGGGGYVRLKVGAAIRGRRVYEHNGFAAVQL